MKRLTALSLLGLFLFTVLSPPLSARSSWPGWPRIIGSDRAREGDDGGWGVPDHKIYADSQWSFSNWNYYLELGSYYFIVIKFLNEKQATVENDKPDREEPTSNRGIGSQ
ncbi:MAG TPA: hypothetical protein VN285_10880 [Candidatus Deferrimicrobium sp.]|nr:hypothetical protein [Candidatus Deferrimicrobium sp.]